MPKAITCYNNQLVESSDSKLWSGALHVLVAVLRLEQPQEIMLWKSATLRPPIDAVLPTPSAIVKNRSQSRRRLPEPATPENPMCVSDLELPTRSSPSRNRCWDSRSRSICRMGSKVLENLKYLEMLRRYNKSILTGNHAKQDETLAEQNALRIAQLTQLL